MNNKMSIYLIVGISLFVVSLHFLIGPEYDGIFRKFVTGYLIDILLPMNLYLLLQISLRQHISLFKSRLIGASFTFLFGLAVEILQLYDFDILGSTYDLLDIFMYASGVLIGLSIDFIILDKFEKSRSDEL